jgi:hypothetical protein
VQRILLSDDELWRAIVENTDAMSALIHEWIELGVVLARRVMPTAG